MVTVTETSKTNFTNSRTDVLHTDVQHTTGGSSGIGSGGGGDGRRGGGGGHDDEFGLPERDRTQTRYRAGLAVGLAGIVMMFSTLTIAYVSLVGTAEWQTFRLPGLLWISTALILLSSFTFERARQAWRKPSSTTAQHWLIATTLLGAGFLCSQVICWRELTAQDIDLASGLYSSFFYLLTGLHALHIIGGVAALSYIVLRVRLVEQRTEAERDPLSAALVSFEERSTERLKLRTGAAMDISALYWHFVDGLWVYVFALLLFWQ